MDMIKTIETLAQESMCKDLYSIYKGLKSIKKMGDSPEGCPKRNRAAQALLKLAKGSARCRQKRADLVPGLISYDPNLPINKKKDDIISSIRQHPVVIISGETGSGKTTQIPKFCLEAGRGTAGLIGCTQPRRIAAVTVAKRIAFELNQDLGQSVGYKIRFDDKTFAHSHIKLMTDGILLAETQQDRFLNQYDTLIVDEAHERSLNIDFTLGILRKLVKKRTNLKLIITSATIDTEKFSKAFDNAPVIEVSGRMFPVETRYEPGGEERGEDQGYVEAAAQAAGQLLARPGRGDILIFMPTEQDIGETIEILRGKNRPGVIVLPLFARLSAKEQAKVFSTGPGRKIIVATNVAETSLTIPGIKYVIDTGVARIPSYSPRTRTTALPVSPISQSSANQRMGRCGRVENGICIRLYDEDDFMGRPFFTAPEILRSNLAEVILRMISLNLGDVATFPFIDPPAPKSIKDGFDTLRELGAIKAEHRRNRRRKGSPGFVLTPMGKIMARMPVDPKLSRILLAAKENNCLGEAVIIVTALTISDIRQRPADKAQAADQKHSQFRDPSSDFITLLNIWNACAEAGKRLKSRSKVRKWCIDNYLSFKRLREWQDIHRQIHRMLEDQGMDKAYSPKLTLGSKGLKSKEFELGGPLYTAIHKSLLHGYLAGIARKKEKNIFTAAKGQQAMIFPGSGLFSKAGSWIVAAEFVKTSQLFARGIANIDPSWIEEIAKDLCTRTYSSPHWEKKRGEVIATEQVSLFGLIIVSGRNKAYGKINPQEAGEIFIRHALVQGEVLLPFTFMKENQKLMEDLEELENKTRKKNILASEEDMYQFYLSRLPRPFYNVRTFAKFLKDRAGDEFLKMTLADLQKSQVEERELALFPDTLEMEEGKFALAYDFNPGSDTDGVTLKVPADSAAQVSGHKVEKLVPGLFQEKIAALIRQLPKTYRKSLVPVQDTAALIAREMPRQDRPLFTLLSTFIQERFNLNIPASTWSEENLPDHLKMRISIRDEKDREIRSLRDLSILGEFAKKAPVSKNRAFDQACRKYEITGIGEWNFPDLVPEIMIGRDSKFTRKAFPGLKIETDDSKKDTKKPQGKLPILCLRLFKSSEMARQSHVKGVRYLYELGFPDDFKALKKDIRSAAGIKQIAPYFNGSPGFQEMIYKAIIREYFEKDFRTRDDFFSYQEKIRPKLYAAGQDCIKLILDAGREYQACFSLIQKLSLASQKRPAAFEILTRLFKELKNLTPPNFPELYGFDRISNLPRYLKCLAIRAQRAADNPIKENQKTLLVAPFENRLNSLLSSLSDKSTREKADAVESFYWLLEEYKISVFAQEIKTAVKVSAKRLDKALISISAMV